MYARVLLADPSSARQVGCVFLSLTPSQARNLPPYGRSATPWPGSVVVGGVPGAEKINNSGASPY
jgi:hypothetical protein